MEYEIGFAEPWGKVLWLTDGTAQVGVSLDFGLRVVSLSCVGKENLFYAQPADGSDGFTTESGWRLRGGHRFWLAPESDDSYAPDNDPITYEILSDGVCFTQKADEILQVQKSLVITFCDGEIRLEHKIVNLANEPKTWALWGVNTLDGGEAEIPFPSVGGYSPYRTVSLWSDTDLRDPRLHFRRDGLTAKHVAIPGYCKLGLGLAEPPVVLYSKGQRLEIGFGVLRGEDYPDKGCNFELYMNDLFMELETLGVRCCLNPGEQASHIETWKIEAIA